MDLATLNAARRWWLEHMPWLGYTPGDDEVLTAYGHAMRTFGLKA